MAVIAQIDVAGVTPDEYDSLRAKVGWLDDVPAGGIAHLTWFDGRDCHNVDAWESEDALNEFAANRLGPGMAALGITSVPQITLHPAHEVFVHQAVTITAS